MSGTRKAMLLSLGRDEDGRPLVERPAPGKAPTAFRVWAAGENATDDGVFLFSERSASLLLEEQESRGREYSFDFDHRSTLPDVSPEAGQSAGWYRLEVRRDPTGGPELWLVGCRFVDQARDGLEAEVPAWRFFSPFYYTDEKTREVVSWVNCALTNNPLTHAIPALASAASRELARTSLRLRMASLIAKVSRLTPSFVSRGGERTMKEKLLQALAVLADPNASDDDKKAAVEALSAYFDTLSDEPTPEAASDAGDPEPEKASETPEEEPKEEKASALVLAELKQLRGEVAALKKASAVGAAPRASKASVIPRTEPKPATEPMDPHAAVAISMIERAAKNTTSTLGK